MSRAEGDIAKAEHLHRAQAAEYVARNFVDWFSAEAETERRGSFAGQVPTVASRYITCAFLGFSNAVYMSPLRRPPGWTKVEYLAAEAAVELLSALGERSHGLA